MANEIGRQSNASVTAGRARILKVGAEAPTSAGNCRNEALSMLAAMQQRRCTIAPAGKPASGAGNLRLLQPPAGFEAAPQPPLMSLAVPRQYYIQGVTKEGRSFRPSDWAERLAGAMSTFRPGGGQGGISAAIGYSPYCVPRVVDGIKCVMVNEALRGIEPMAWDFVMNFARDNELRVVEITAPK